MGVVPFHLLCYVGLALGSLNSFVVVGHEVVLLVSICIVVCYLFCLTESLLGISKDVVFEPCRVDHQSSPRLHT